MAISNKTVSLCDVYSRYGKEGLTEEGECHRKVVIGGTIVGIGGLALGIGIIALTIILRNNPSMIYPYYITTIGMWYFIGLGTALTALSALVIGGYLYIGYGRSLSVRDIKELIQPDTATKLSTSAGLH